MEREWNQQGLKAPRSNLRPTVEFFSNTFPILGIFNAFCNQSFCSKVEENLRQVFWQLQRSLKGLTQEPFLIQKSRLNHIIVVCPPLPLVELAHGLLLSYLSV